MRESPSAMAAILFVCPHHTLFVWSTCALRNIGMTGVGDGVSGFDPPRAHTRLPSDHRTKKGAAKRGKSHRGAQKRTRGIVRNCFVRSKARARLNRSIKTECYISEKHYGAVT